MDKKEFDQLRKEYKKKIKEIEKDLIKQEKEYLNNLGGQIVEKMLTEGVWHVKHLTRSDFSLFGLKTEFPLLAELVVGLQVFDSIPFEVNGYSYGITAYDDEIFLNLMRDFYKDEEMEAGVKDLVPLVMAMNLKLDFTEADSYVEFEEKYIGELRRALERLRATQYP